MQLVLIFFLLHKVTAVFYGQHGANHVIKYADEILAVTSEPSVLSCAHRCRFLDKQSIVVYSEEGTCSCMRRSEVEDENASKINGDAKTVYEMKPFEDIKKFANIAVNKTSSQISTYQPNVASRANDGLLLTYCATYDASGQEWWKVDLGQVYDIKLMRLIPNDWALNEGRYKMIEVYTSEVESEIDNLSSGARLCRSIDEITTSSYDISCYSSLTRGRFAKVVLKHAQTLYIAEFEVYVECDADVNIPEQFCHYMGPVLV